MVVGLLIEYFYMLILVLNAVLFTLGFFFIFMVIASRICKRFLLLFLFMIFVLLIRIFLIPGGLIFFSVFN